MFANPLVSVIVPTYNRQKYLRSAIQSVLLQEERDFEILVCDDGSTDESKAMVEALEDPRIRWIAGPHSGGPAAPRNRGIKAARGQWYAFLDSDDQWHPNKLSKQLAATTGQNLRMSCTNAQILTEKALSHETYFHETEDTLLTFQHLLKVNKVICSSMFVHHTVFEQIGLFPDRPLFHAIEDYALWLSCAMIDKVAYLGTPLTIYRDEPEESIRSLYASSECYKKQCVLREALRRTARINRYRLFYRLRLVGALLSTFIPRTC